MFLTDKIKDFKLSYKLTALFMFMALIVAATGGFGMFKIKTVSGLVQDMLKLRATQEKMAVLMKVAVQECRVNLLEAATMPADIDEFELYRGDYEAKRDRFRGYGDLLLKGNDKVGITPAPKGSELEKRVKAVQESWTAFENIAGKMLSYKEGLLKTSNPVGTKVAANSIMIDKKLHDMAEQDIYAESDKVNAAIDNLLVTVGNLMTQANEEVSAIQLKAKIAFIVVIVSAILIALMLGTFTTKNIVSSITKITERLRDIAEGEGDLTKRLDVSSKDEIGELARWFNLFMQNMQEVITSVRENAEKVSVASIELSATAESLNAETTSQRIQTELVAESMAEMSQSITGVVNNAKATSEASQQASAIAEKGKEVVERTVTGMEKIAGTVKDTSDIIQKLNENSNEIGNILKVINDIAEQTNLLALNAAIEAARAGEQGRGFSVVAGEVRKLAESTGNATKDIADMIKKIQNDSALSVASMKSGKEEVVKGVMLAEEAKHALHMIVDTSEQATNSVMMISSAAVEQSNNTDDITRNMQSILVASFNSAEATKQVKLSSEELERLALELRTKIELFKV